ncbi:MAG: bifunctional diaminohydroxyphosphoribosylaminopyrimidine deaminase/5-amino-6-(5-phosphoribosylamino)uracil reductase RibD [Mariprofundaceae bacterium]|nr:bifunctional diaminohydroxyphosphoribosylaminopyrimidine deaminase/5-amino-6-(5-phosphoribosylamino)uracil reductase RibD [Mariprofundaceae bacterium]
MHKTDEYWMLLAIRQAKKGIGKTHPNPRVGAVVVRDGQCLGQGYHHVCGGNHAEVDALLKINTDVAGATIYVTLEPCAATGRTPACTTAIIQAGIKRVVFASTDPNPKMAGGAEVLKQAGIEVLSGVCVAEADAMNRPFFHYLQTGLPWLIAKAAISLDGKLATHQHHSQWISGDVSRQHAHQMRAQCDAIVVGVGTLLADNPSLTVREARLKGEPPLRVVMAKAAPQPFVDCKLLSQAANTRLYITQDNVYAQQWRDLGVDVVLQESLKACFKHLAKQGCLLVLLEGGGKLHAACFEEKLSNEIMLYQAPLLIGGTDAVNLWHGQGVSTMPEALSIQHIQRKKLGQDMLIRGDVHYPA